VGRGHHVGAGVVDPRVDGEGGPVHRPGALDDVAVVVAEDEVRRLDLLEAHPERVDPEVVEALGVAGGDVAGDALVEPEPAEDPEGRRQPPLAVLALLLRRAVDEGLGGHYVGHGGAPGRADRTAADQPTSRRRRRPDPPVNVMRRWR
jgi:hypothetical protein